MRLAFGSVIVLAAASAAQGATYFDVVSLQCDPLSCVEEYIVPAFGSGQASMDAYGECDSGAEPYAYAGAFAQGCWLDTYIEAGGGKFSSDGGAAYYDDNFGLIYAGGVAGAGMTYEEGVLVYSMETSADCWIPGLVENIPPPQPC